MSETPTIESPSTVVATQEETVLPRPTPLPVETPKPDHTANVRTLPSSNMTISSEPVPSPVTELPVAEKVIIQEIPRPTKPVEVSPIPQKPQPMAVQEAPHREVVSETRVSVSAETADVKPVVVEPQKESIKPVVEAEPVEAVEPAPEPVIETARDISAQYTDRVRGIPIIRNPKACSADNPGLTVTVTGVKKAKGSIVADLHNDVKEDFLKSDKVVLRVRADAEAGETRFCIPLVKGGDYAVAVYHDKNNNSAFDKNFLGIPKERFGISNNPKFGMKAPEYEQAVFSVPDEGRAISIRLASAADILARR